MITLFAANYEERKEAEQAARLFNYAVSDDFLLTAPDVSTMLSTVARVPDLHGMARFPRDRQNPTLKTLRALQRHQGQVVLSQLRESVTYMDAIVTDELAKDASYFWLQLAPAQDQAGTLSSALSAFAEEQVSLDFLHSDEVMGGSHQFFLGFAAELTTYEKICESLRSLEIRATALAGFRR